MVAAIQDQIYVKRKTDWPIPDAIYFFFREGQESDMKYSSSELERRFELL